jgi:hypothetical protein
MFLDVIEDWPFGSQGLKQSPLPETISMKPTQKTSVSQVKLCQRECKQIPNPERHVSRFELSFSDMRACRDDSVTAVWGVHASSVQWPNTSEFKLVSDLDDKPQPCT